jgi:hypothetical protein
MRDEAAHPMRKYLSTGGKIMVETTVDDGNDRDTYPFLFPGHLPRRRPFAEKRVRARRTWHHPGTRATEKE